MKRDDAFPPHLHTTHLESVMHKPIQRRLYCFLCPIALACAAGASCCDGAEVPPEDSAAKPGSAEVALQIELADPIEPSKPARTYTVMQRRDADGLPVEYSLFISTPVCMDGKCKAVEVTMFWNALGYYERIECPPDKPLTKKEHEPFDAADYTKLDRILRDPHSVLGKHSLAFMVERTTGDQAAGGPVPDDQGIDAWTGPTPVTVQQSVVQHAAYTTWVMWRWANGEIVDKLRNITERECSPAFLKRLLHSQDPRRVDFALQHLVEHCSGDAQYVGDVFRVLEQGNRNQAMLSLRFLSETVKDKNALYARLAESCCRMKPFCSPIVLDYFAADSNLPAAGFDELTSRLDRLPYFQVHLVLRILEDHKFFSKKTEADVAALLDSQDFFIARRASEYLLKQDLAGETENKLNVFRERNRDRL